MTQQFKSSGNDALPVIASALKPEELNNFSLVNRLFHDSANCHFRKKIFEHIANVSEIKLTKEIVIIINQLKYARQVYALLHSKNISKNLITSFKVESDLLIDFNNPTCWFFLDDNLKAFLACFDDAAKSKIYLPLALRTSRLNIATFLMQYTRDFNYQQKASLYWHAVASEWDTFKLVTFNDTQPRNADRLSIVGLINRAALFGNEKILRAILTSYTKETFQREYAPYYTRENLLEAAIKSGNINVISIVREFQKRNDIQCFSKPLTVDAISSGNIAMIDFIYNANKKENNDYDAHSVHCDLSIAATQRPEVYKHVREKLISRHKIQIEIYANILGMAIFHGRIDTFEVALKDYKYSCLDLEAIEEIFIDAVRSGNVVVLNYVLALADNESVQIKIEQNHLTLASTANAEMYSKIIALAKKQNTILHPTEDILQNACQTNSKRLVKRVLEHADEHGVLQEKRKRIIKENIGYDKSVGLLELAKDWVNPEDFNIDNLRTTLLTNPFFIDEITSLSKVKSVTRVI